MTKREAIVGAGLLLAAAASLVVPRTTADHLLTGDETMVGLHAAAIATAPRNCAPPPTGSLRVFGRDYPLQSSFYRAPWDYYLATPFVLLRPDDLPAALRLYTESWWIVAMAATGLLAFSLSGSALAGFLALAWTGTHPWMIGAVVSGTVIGGIPSAALTLLALLALRRAALGGRAAWALSCFTAGLGAALAPQGAALSLGWLAGVFYLMPALRANLGRFLRAALPLLLIGPAPLLLWYALAPGPFLLAGEALARHPNIFMSVRLRLSQLADIFIGQSTGYLSIVWVWIATASFFASASTDDRRYGPIVLTALILVILSPFTLSSLRPHHLLPLIPLIAVLAACGAVASSWPRLTVLVALASVAANLVRSSAHTTHGWDTLLPARWLLANKTVCVVEPAGLGVITAIQLLQCGSPESSPRSISYNLFDIPDGLRQLEKGMKPEAVCHLVDLDATFQRAALSRGYRTRELTSVAMGPRKTPLRLFELVRRTP